MTEKRTEKTRIAFLGGGNMAEALIRGLLADKRFKSGDVSVADPDAQRRSHLSATYGVKVTADNRAAATSAGVVVVAVKPGLVAGVLHECADALSRKLALSIAAGVSLTALRRDAPEARWVRVMPNTPALVGAGMSVLCAAEGVPARDRKLAVEIFASAGRALEIDNESLLDAVTGLSGSGPAFVFLFLEALADGGVKAGLPRQLARELAAQTVYGAAKLALESDRHTGELKDMVTSPGGTTIAGVEALETSAFRAAVMSAVEAAYRRSKELGGAA